MLFFVIFCYFLLSGFAKSRPPPPTMPPMHNEPSRKQHTANFCGRDRHGRGHGARVQGARARRAPGARQARARPRAPRCAIGTFNKIICAARVSHRPTPPRLRARAPRGRARALCLRAMLLAWLHECAKLSPGAPIGAPENHTGFFGVFLWPPKTAPWHVQMILWPPNAPRICIRTIARFVLFACVCIC